MTRANNAESLIRLRDPKPGDRFTEMFSFWVHVMHVAPDLIVVEEYTPPCHIGLDRRVRVFQSGDEFYHAYSKHFEGGPSYATVYWVDSTALELYNGIGGWDLQDALEEAASHPDADPVMRLRRGMRTR